MKKLSVLFLLLASVLAFSASADACEKCLEAEKANTSSVSFWLTRWQHGENTLQVSLTSIAAGYGWYDVADFLGGTK